MSDFKPEYVGKMRFYLAVLDDTVRLKDENPSVGIILCKSKNKTVVEYALRDTSKPINIASYRLGTELPAHPKGALPSPGPMRKLLENIEDD